MFKKIADVLSRRPAAAPKPAPELENTRTFRAHLLAKGLSEAEASRIIVDRVVAASLFYQAKGYTFHQVICEMPPRVWYTIPTGEANERLYWDFYRRSKNLRQFLPHDFTPS